MTSEHDILKQKREERKKSRQKNYKSGYEMVSDPDQVDEETGKTLLHMQTNLPEDRLGMIKWLIEHHNASVNPQDDEGRTPLHDAVLNRNFAATKKLIEYGALIDIKDDYNKTPIDIAEILNEKEIKELLLTKGKKTTDD